MIETINNIGLQCIVICNQFGEYAIFVYRVLKSMVTRGINRSRFLVQVERIGVDSLPICTLIGIFSGAVMTLQAYYGFVKFGSENMIGPVVALSLTRELGPVLTGIMVTGRSGSSIAAEIGTMKITEQIDALETLCIDTYDYLAVPRILAGFLILPFLTLFTMLFGLIGGYLIYTYYFHLNAAEFIDGIKDFLELSDIVGGMIKGSVFGFLLSSIGSYCGFFTRGGAKGVGLATIKSVVVASISILISNYFLAMLLFKR